MENINPDGNNFTLSVKTTAGLANFLAALEQRVAARVPVGGEPVITRARHRQALEKTLAALERFAVAPTPELAAEDLRLAVRSLGEIMGQVDVEELLDIIFADFCIGK